MSIPSVNFNSPQRRGRNRSSTEPRRTRKNIEFLQKQENRNFPQFDEKSESSDGIPLLEMPSSSNPKFIDISDFEESKSESIKEEKNFNQDWSATNKDEIAKNAARPPRRRRIVPQNQPEPKEKEVEIKPPEKKKVVKRKAEDTEQKSEEEEEIVIKQPRRRRGIKRRINETEQKLEEEEEEQEKRKFVRRRRIHRHGDEEENQENEKIDNKQKSQIPEQNQQNDLPSPLQPVDPTITANQIRPTLSYEYNVDPPLSEVSNFSMIRKKELFGKMSFHMVSSDKCLFAAQMDEDDYGPIFSIFQKNISPQNHCGKLTIHESGKRFVLVTDYRKPNDIREGQLLGIYFSKENSKRQLTVVTTKNYKVFFPITRGLDMGRIAKNTEKNERFNYFSTIQSEDTDFESDYVVKSVKNFKIVDDNGNLIYQIYKASAGQFNVKCGAPFNEFMCFAISMAIIYSK